MNPVTSVLAAYAVLMAVLAIREHQTLRTGERYEADPARLETPDRMRPAPAVVADVTQSERWRELRDDFEGARLVGPGK